MSQKPIVVKKNESKTKKPELLYYGLHICRKLVDRRREDIIRVYCTEELMPKFKDILQWCAGQKKAYHIVSPKDLEKIAGSVHHEGVAILARRPEALPLSELEKRLKSDPDTPLIYMDGVQNPHNIGTIMRVMASFGWPYLVGATGMAPMSAAGARMSEGGAEFVEVFAAGSGAEFLEWAKAHDYAVYGTSSHESSSLYDLKLSKRSVFILGHEVHGMSKDLEKKVDKRIAIPATGQVESLNVAVASGIVVAEYTRQHGLHPAKA